MALIGQSGSGKSLTLKALIGMLPNNLDCELEIEADFELIRGKTIAYIPQNPFTALSPLTKIKNQFFCNNIKERLDMVGLRLELLDKFPPQLSGGELQRVIIAMALNDETKLMLLDEPTTALDTQNKEKILLLIKELQEKRGFKVLFVSHDLKSVMNLCKEIYVIKDGLIIQKGTINELTCSFNEYSLALFNSSFGLRGYRE